MAGEWIKMRLDLAEDPAVIAMAAALDVDEDLVVGKLHRLWSWADRQSRDGHATGVTEKWIDRFIRFPGFAATMVAVGWLEIDKAGIRLPNFDRHNGETAKTRALGAKRQQKARASSNAPVTAASRSERDGSVTREEKRREEALDIPPHTEGTIGSPAFDPAPEDAVGAFEGHPPADTAKATEAGLSLVGASLRIRAAGCEDVSASSPHLIQALADGITVQELCDIAAGKGKGKGIAYLVKTARGLRADAAASAGAVPTASGSTRNTQGPSPRLSAEEEKQRKADALAAMERQHKELGYAPH